MQWLVTNGMVLTLKLFWHWVSLQTAFTVPAKRGRARIKFLLVAAPEAAAQSWSSHRGCRFGLWWHGNVHLDAPRMTNSLSQHILKLVVGRLDVVRSRVDKSRSDNLYVGTGRCNTSQLVSTAAAAEAGHDDRAQENSATGMHVIPNQCIRKSVSFANKPTSRSVKHVVSWCTWHLVVLQLTG